MLWLQVLLMGKSGSGKTSMRSIIFANYIARDTRRLGATIEVEHSHVRFLGNLVLNLWDCGGQEAFMENYFVNQRDNIFRNVEVLIYVFDVESRELDKDLHYYQSCLEAIAQNSRDAKIFCLIHKMDLLSEEERELTFRGREDSLLELSLPLVCTCFQTSIWDETLYMVMFLSSGICPTYCQEKVKKKRPSQQYHSLSNGSCAQAWSSIVYALIPNVQQLEFNLQTFADILDADEVLLFERATFLVSQCSPPHLGDVLRPTPAQMISHSKRKDHRDIHRFEKVSNIIKQFKLSCSKLAAQFQCMEVRNSHFDAFIDIFTPNTYVMVVMSDPDIPSAVTRINIQNARKHFEKLEGCKSSSSLGSK
ncbi:RRAGB [Cordylochernes scorpioides]|uniref:RRAGB n=1 Tax=Cordylochernes scorpioides TaxID=51811 RepID=A0ABY6LPX3_9ARAC|nr:RRAGB [Cordylochernes scorpioides]